MEFVHHAAEFLADLIDLLVIILFGTWVLVTVVMSARSIISGGDPNKITRDVRFYLGSHILLGLELLIISDLLHSIASRTLEDLAIVAGLVAIRVTLAYFLDREIRHLEANSPTEE